jgi:uncharacterized damage-inducible protein DinB
MSAAHYAAWVEPLAARDRNARVEAVRLARSLDEASLKVETGDIGWSVRDELTHMAAADPDLVSLLRAILAGQRPDTSVFADIDARNAQHLDEYQGRAMSQIADELEHNQAALDELFAQLTDADEARQPVGMPFPLRQLIDGYSQHHPYHIDQIHAALVQSSHG